jgi:predicted nucleic acid-binding protein
MSGVLADTSIWVAHFRRPDARLQSLLLNDELLCHPLIVIEIACGTPPAPRERTISDLKALRQGVVATPDEILAFIEREHLADCGCGAIDAALLASALLTPGARLWTADKPLGALARRMHAEFDPR